MWPSWVIANRAAAGVESLDTQTDATFRSDRSNASPYETLEWLAHAFVSTQLMVHDSFFYNRTLGKYTVDRYLDDLEARYGGVDSVLMW